VKSKADPRFWKSFNELPSDIQQLARRQFKLWQTNPFHPVLHFKELRPQLWSVRVNQKYRALAHEQGELIVWFWIGTHDTYDSKI
jgi:hypothetical protein